MSRRHPFGWDYPPGAEHDLSAPYNQKDEEPRVYDKSGVNPKGIPEDKTRCIAEVTAWSGWHSYQCQRKRGYGQDGLYCKQHAKRHPA